MKFSFPSSPRSYLIITWVIYLGYCKIVAKRVPKIHIACFCREDDMAKVVDQFKHDKWHFSINSFS